MGTSTAGTTGSLTVTTAIDEVNDAWLFGGELKAARRAELARFLASRQGLPGSYCGLFAPVDGELDDGYRLWVGDRLRSNGGARHILGEEALRALVMLRRGRVASDAAVGLALEQASEAIDRRLTAHERRPSGLVGHYCCMRCSVALWRALAVRALPRSEERLAGGLRLLRERREENGTWRGFPFHYVLAALVDAQQEGVVDELRHARYAVANRLGYHRANVGDIYVERRRMVMEQVFERTD